jgi:hypothetical protein
MRCPSCRVRLNRRIDVQFVFLLLVFCALAVMPILAFGATLAAVLAGAFLGASASWLFDLVTIRPVIAGRWKGIRGYDV